MKIDSNNSPLAEVELDYDYISYGEGGLYTSLSMGYFHKDGNCGGRSHTSLSLASARWH